MTERLRVRRYERPDKDEVIHLHKLALDQIFANLGDGPWDSDLQKIEETYLKNRGEFLVAVLDDKIVGMGALRRRDDSVAEIKRMRVHPKHQGRGIGKLILGGLEDAAKKYGYTTLILDTCTEQVTAQKMYEKHGYKKIRETKLGRFDSMIYEKDI